MGRPDLTEIRTAQILDAFERCVARFGLDGSSLDRVAGEAGVKRSILRHYVGNRDDLVVALAERVVTKYRERLEPLPDDIGADERITTLIEMFLPNEPVETADSVLVVEALIGAAERYPTAGRLVFEYIDELVRWTADELGRARRDAADESLWAVAYGLVSLCFNQESLGPLNLPRRFGDAARSNARLLVASLSPE